MRILLTRVTRIFQLSVFTKFALAGLAPGTGPGAHAEFRVSNAARDLAPRYLPVMALLFCCRLLDFLFIFRGLRSRPLYSSCFLQGGARTNALHLGRGPGGGGAHHTYS